MVKIPEDWRDTEVWVASGGFTDCDASFGLIVNSDKFTKTRAESLWDAKELDHLTDTFEASAEEDDDFDEFVETWWWTGFFLEPLGSVLPDGDEEKLDDLFGRQGWAYQD